MSKKYKWFALILIILAFFVFGGMTHAIPITDCLIVSGMGLDLDPSTREYIVTFQVIVPSKSASSSGSTNTKVITVSDVTVAGALSKLSSYSEKTVSLSHCSVLVLGKTIIDDNAVSMLDYVTSNNYLSENVFLAAAENSAQELFLMTGALNETLPFTISAMVSLNDNFKTVKKMTIRTFLIDYFKKGETNCIPIITPMPILGQMGADTQGESSEYMFIMQKAAVIKENKRVMDLDDIGTGACNFMEKKINKGTLTMQFGDERMVCLDIFQKEQTIKYYPDEKKVSAKIIISAFTTEVRSGENNSQLGHSPVSGLSGEDKSAMENKVKLEIADTFEATRKEGADVYHLLEGFYRANSKKGKYIKLEDIQLDISIIIEFM